MVKVRHSYGQTYTYESEEEALEALQDEYGEQIETEADEEGRTLVWEHEPGASRLLAYIISP